MTPQMTPPSCAKRLLKLVAPRADRAAVEAELDELDPMETLRSE
jgi:hypothetical protein